jgi:hypothetical protein
MSANKLKVAAALAAALTLLLAAESVTAQTYLDLSSEGPLTQADIDAYIYLTPRLVGDMINDSERLTVLREVKLTKRRAIYISAKIPLAQAMAVGLISPGHLLDERVPPYLHPLTAEVQLVNRNLTSLMKAEEEARINADIKVPIKMRKTPPL